MAVLYLQYVYYTYVKQKYSTILANISEFTFF